IVNGTLVTASETFPAELRMEDGRIAAVGCNLARPGDEVVDAGGLLVMPGGVDVHTHLDLPSMGTVASDDFESGTLAAVFGGTTSIVDFVTPAKGKTLTESLELWRQKAEGRAVIDYGLHMSVTEMAADTLEQMEAVFEQGVTSFKVFTAYPGVLMLDDAAILRALRWSAKRGALIQVHAENGLAIAELVASLAAEGKLEPRHHAASRPS
ncbi:MAG TPA: dihydropyrimidinase, partial [Myxococcales bacterium]|nr:dihydropyrimidinase [Myxococcales bacterium]